MTPVPVVTPITAGYHISENENFSVGLGVWAPTGDYDSTKLANTSLNNWTFIPTFSYTKYRAQRKNKYELVAYPTPSLTAADYITARPARRELP